MDLTIFEKATRQMLRFPSPIGDLTVESLWQLPLVDRDGQPSLDATARVVNAQLREFGEGGFVKTAKPDPRITELTTKLDVLKRIIEVKEAEAEAAKQAAANRAQKQKLVAALSRKKEDELVGMSTAELEKAIDDLPD